ncbi:Translation initiation factor IF-2 [Sarcoptes scabiei]|uniref:Translation initiation factor IF-2, mitochondrial n=1 Tax=Sarcoptes scabiei TaxID=52283 RepID=A0A834R4R3_SARSC|nr:Translation initiation factor IF-2 [Sarcoptes scabiei]
MNVHRSTSRIFYKFFQTIYRIDLKNAALQNAPRKSHANPTISFESIVKKIEDYSALKIGTDVRKRPPIVTIMGHVDHGKTTLLDSIRKSELVKGEHGGITQHIGAFVVALDENNKRLEDLVVFLDTPGHKAFSLMRERGALVTDIVVLVVAADDGVMEQTIESINFAQKYNVPMIVAVNKIDKVQNIEDNLDNIRLSLKAYGLKFEDEGGDTQVVRISALQNQGIYELKESILALAETLELKARVDGHVRGNIIESSIHPHRGRLSTVLVQQGTLKKTNYLVAVNFQNESISWAKVRSMFNENGQVIDQTRPGFPAQIIGWRDDSLPNAGDEIWQLNSERQIKEILEMNRTLQSEKKKFSDLIAINEKRQEHEKVYKTELLALREAGIRYKRKKAIGPRQKLYSKEDDEFKISVVLKADVDGSMEVLLDLFDSFPNESSPIKLNLVHYSLGNVTENDIELASCFPNGIIYTFNVGVFTPALLKLSKELGVPIKRFNVIYHLVDHLKETLENQQIIGEAIVLQEFIINEKKKKVPVAGCRCSKGSLNKNSLYRLIRSGKTIADNLKLVSIRHHKNEVDTIKKDLECGLMFEDNFIQTKQSETIRFQSQDVLVCYHLVDVKQKLHWTPKGF